MKRRPWLKFDPNAWLTDPYLRACSSAHRGTLIDLMCVAHNHDPYGYITTADSPETRRMLAKCLSLPLQTLNRQLTYLIQMTRICATPEGHLYIKRMVTDHEYALQQSAFGTMGWNHTLKGGHKPEEKREDKEEEKKGGGKGPVKRGKKKTSPKSIRAIKEAEIKTCFDAYKKERHIHKDDIKAFLATWYDKIGREQVLLAEAKINVYERKLQKGDG